MRLDPRQITRAMVALVLATLFFIPSDLLESANGAEVPLDPRGGKSHEVRECEPATGKDRGFNPKRPGTGAAFGQGQ